MSMKFFTKLLVMASSPQGLQANSRSVETHSGGAAVRGSCSPAKATYLGGWLSTSSSVTASPRASRPGRQELPHVCYPLYLFVT